jgi:hypothetical protein
MADDHWVGHPSVASGLSLRCKSMEKTLPPFHELITSILEWALLPFALGLGVNVFIVGERVMSTIAGGIAGVFVAILALGLGCRSKDFPLDCFFQSH